eukprot:scaffold242058_cov29-Tisochrysis_lutea.AAC.1
MARGQDWVVRLLQCAAAARLLPSSQAAPELTLVPSLLLSTCERRLVLPAPRKPERMVMGMGESGGAPLASAPSESTGRPPRPPRTPTCSASGERKSRATPPTPILRSRARKRRGLWNF